MRTSIKLKTKAVAGVILLLSAGVAGAQSFTDFMELMASMAGDWEYDTVVPDDFDEDIWDYVETALSDSLTLASGDTVRMSLWVYCDGPTVAVWGPPAVRFEHDLENRQWVTYRFDNGKAQVGAWVISDRRTTEGLFVPDGDEDRFVRELNRSTHLRLMIQPLGGEEQMIRFSVQGLEAALEQCL